MKRKSKAAHPASEAQPNRKQKQRSSLPPMVLLPVLLGMAVMAALLVRLQQAYDTEQNSQQVHALATTYNQQLEVLLDVANTNIRHLPTHTSLINALLLQDAEALRRLEREWVQSPYLTRVFIMQSGSNHADQSLSFAALDHLGLAATGQQSSLEYVNSSDGALFYQASPVFHPQQSRVIGTLLLVYDAQAMLARFVEPELQGGWTVSLQQQLPQAPQLTFYQAGPGLAGSTPQSLTTAHPYWQLSVGMEQPQLLHSPWLPLYAGLLLAALLSALAALLLLRNHLRQLQALDVNVLLQAIQEKQPQLLEQLARTGLQPLAEPVRKLLLHTARPAASTASSKPAAHKQSTGATDAAQQSGHAFADALDIDILDLELDDNALHSANTAMNSLPKADPGIFRAYDIRGIVDTNLDSDTAYWIGRAVGSESIARGEARVVVGRDGRLSGPQLQEALIRGLVDTGCTVLDLGMVPTPLVYFGTHQLDATSGVMVTGSHNPPSYNGFKIVIAGETLANERITALYQRIISQDLLHSTGSMQQVNLLDQYVDYIGRDVALGNSLKVVVDCGNGVAGVIAPRLLESIGCQVIPLYCEVDGTFPNHHPDPGKPENLQDLIRTVQTSEADLGIAFDGDGDRLGVVTNKGEIIYPDRLLMLLAEDVISRNPGCDVIYDVKCTRKLTALISRSGGRPIMWKTGHSLMKAKLQETGALLAGEMSGHIYFKERWFGFDDGIYAAARLLEILSMDSDSVNQVFARYPASPSTPELNIEVTEASKFSIIQALQESADWGDGSVTALDGIRVDYPKGWGLIRASNTTPMLVLRFEGDSEEDLQQIQNLFRDQLLAVAPDIHWPF